MSAKWGRKSVFLFYASVRGLLTLKRQKYGLYTDGESKIFCDFVFECYLSQLVTVPTHCKGNCLDLVLTNSPHAINNIQVGISSVMKSDHLLVSFSLTTEFRPSFNVHETQCY